MGAYKSHAHHDEYDPLKGLIKKIIDAHKEILRAIYELFLYQPELRHTLGPSTSCFYHFVQSHLSS
jgi:hypothetical protein